MMKHFNILFTALSIIGCSSGQTVSSPKNDRIQMGLSGNVKSVESELYNLIPEKETFRIGEKINSLSVDRNSLLEFDDKGNITTSKEFLSNGEISAETKYTYDKKGRLNYRREIDNYGKGSFYDYNFSFNSKDSIIRVEVSNQQIKRVHQIDRDYKNRVIKNKITQDDTVIAIYTRNYDNNGNVIEENEYRNQNLPVKIKTRTFDNRNLKQTEQITEFNKWDTLSYQIKYSYDSNLNVVEENEYQNDTVSMKTINKYFKNGGLQETRNVPIGGGYAVVTTRKFNESGDLIEHSRKSSDKSNADTWIYKYKYDSIGNWIEKFEFKNGEPLRIVKRSIDYYQ